MSDTSALEAIYNFRWRGEHLGTAGQPLEDEFPAVAQAGFQVVINLALLDADYSLPDEPGLVRSLGMTFIHIPVSWEMPTADKLLAFFEVMAGHAEQRIFLHCAANMRASVFLALYRILRLGWTREAAMADVHDVWQPDFVWQSFIDDMLAAPPRTK
jgi:protein tyrosine phosphatase (PTP) superfamily phosphohydrolase (DUF442 family)